MKTFTVLAIVFIGAFFCFYNLGSRPLDRWDEGTNAYVIAGSPDILTLRLGVSAFFEKPPLWYAAAHFTTAKFGLQPGTLRLVSALSGFLLLGLVYFAANRIAGTIAGLTSVLVLVSTPHMFLSNAGGVFSTHTVRSADADGLFLLLLTGSYLVFSLAMLPIHMMYGYVLTALAVLTKGPAGFLPLFVYLFYQSRYEKKPFTHTMHLRGMILMIVLIAPWYVFMMNHHGVPFVLDHFGYHLISRAITTLEGHGGPVWYYSTLLAHPQIFPAAILWIPSVLYTMRSTFSRTSYSIFGAVWIPIMYVMGISLMGTKLAWYVLPVYPFAAIITGVAISKLHTDNRYRNSSLKFLPHIVLFYLVLCSSVVASHIFRFG